MPEIIKPNRVVKSEDVVLIPDDDSIVSVVIPDDDTSSPEESVIDEDEGTDEAAPDDEPPKESAEDISIKLLSDTRAECDALLSQAQRDASSLREQARQEGYQAGHGEVTERVNGVISELGELMNAIAESQQTYFADYAKELKYLSLEIAAKIIGRAIDEDKAAMADLVRQAVSTVKGAEWISVEVSDRIAGLVGQLTEEFSIQYPSRQIEVVGSNIPDDHCIIKTSDGILDASLPVQLQNLRDIFASEDTTNV